MKQFLTVTIMCAILLFHQSAYTEPDTSCLINEDLLLKSGSLDETYQSDSKQYIVHIKDAHCNPEAQRNSAEIIRRLIEQHGFSLLCMEGASNPLDISDLASFPDKDIRDEVSLYFLNNGNINGAEYLALITPESFHIEGIEDKQLYRENYFAFYKSLSFRKKSITILDSMIVYFDSLKPFYYSEALLQVDSAYNQFSDGSMTLLELFNTVTSTENSIPTDQSSNIHILNKASQLRQSINFEQAEKEKNAILRACAQYASDAEREKIIQTNLKYTFGQISADELYTFIEEKCDEYLIETNDYPNFLASIQLSKLLAQLDNASVMQDVNTWITNVKKEIIASDTERKIDTWYSSLLILRQGCQLTLAQHATKNLISMYDGFAPDKLWNFVTHAAQDYDLTVSFQKNDIDFVKNALSYVCDFYSAAQERNDRIIENTLRSMRDNGVDRCILYTGGFHTEGLTNLLRTKKIAYSVITPSLADAHKDEPYYYLLSNQKNPFEISLEQAISNQTETQNDTLALESKLVPPAEVMIDTAGVQAFRDQLKTFYLAGGIQKALEDHKSVLFPLVAPLNENQLAQLSSQIQAIAQWRIRNFADLSALNLKRNESGNIDLELTINNQTYYVRDLIVGNPAKRPPSKLYLSQPNHLLTVDINNTSLAIFATPSTGKDITQVLDSITDEEIAMIINHFIDQPNHTPEELQRLLALDIENPQLVIDTLLKNNILDTNADGKYILNPERADALKVAAQLAASKINDWKTIIPAQSASIFPASFSDFINKQKISELVTPGALSFPALLYMVETLPANFSGTSVFPKNNSENFIFSKEPVIGSGTFRLRIDIVDNNYTRTVMQERNILLGNEYATTIQNQLFGVMPQQQQEIIIQSLPYSPTIMLNNPDGTETDIAQPKTESQPSVTWLNPDQTTLFWHQIAESSNQFNEQSFKVSGGLLLGKKVGSNYIVSKIVPFTDKDYTYQDAELFRLNENSVDKLIAKNAIDDIVVLGMYRNHSPRRLLQDAQPGVDRRDTLDIFPFNSRYYRKTVDKNPIGLVFETNLTDEQIQQLQSQPLISQLPAGPADVNAYFYQQIDGNPVVLHQEPALSCAMPGDVLISDSERNLYLRRIKDSTDQTGEGERDIVSFRKLPKNQGFVLIADQSINEEDVSFFVRFFRSIEQDIALLSDIKEIVIKTGMPRAAHVNREDKIIELNIDMLDYPNLIRYLALPHEWNHLQLDYKEEIEEILVIMLDLNRINNLAFRDADQVQKLLESLTSYESPHMGKQLFSQVVEKIINHVKDTNRPLAPLEIYQYTRQLILSDPELKSIVGTALSEVKGSYFVGRLNHILSKDTTEEIPPLLPGANDYIVFEEQSLEKGHAINSNMIDFSRLRVRYLSGNAFQDQGKQLSKLYDLSFSDNIGYFDPRKKEVGINMGNPFHTNEDGSVNHDLVLSSIIHQRTHYLLHQNKGILAKLQSVMEERTDLKDALITYFFAFKNFAAFKEGQALDDLRKDVNQFPESPEQGEQKPSAPSLSSIRKRQMEALQQNPAYAPNGEIDIEKILNEVICSSNAYSSIIFMLHKYEDMQRKFESANQPVPSVVQDRIATLKKFIFAPDQVLLLKMAENARKAMISIDKDIEAAFTIPQQSTLHVFLKDTNADTVAEVDINAVETTAPATQESVTTQAQSVDLMTEATPLKQSNAFLTTVRTFKNQAPPIPIQYTKELAQQNAVDFYEYLREKQRRDPLTALPETINVIDLYLGSPGYAKDFLDHFKTIDTQNLFYKRLSYHMVSHSISSKHLLKQLEDSHQLDTHKSILTFDYLDKLPDASTLTSDAVLVRSFGDITLFEDVALIEKDGDDYYSINGNLQLDPSVAKSINLKQWQSYVQNPSTITPESGQALPDSAFNQLKWNESRSLVDIDGFPYGYFVRSYSEYHPTNRYIYHPQLLQLAQQSLSNMSLNFGGYWQINGNSFSSVDRHIVQPEHATVELDSVFLAGMMQSQGGFLLESQRRYLERKTKQKAVSTVIDELRLVDRKTLSSLIPPVTFADLKDSARIFNTRQELTYRSPDQVTYTRFISDLKKLGYIPQNTLIDMHQDSAGMDDFLHSLTVNLSKSISLDQIAKLLIEQANEPNVVSQKDLIDHLMKQPFIVQNMISVDYIKKALDIVYTLGQNRKNFHIKAEVASPERASIEQETAVASQPNEQKHIRMRTVSQIEFDAYIEDIHRDYPLLDFGDARGIANPITGEVIINKDHPAHKDDDGDVNLAEIRQTIVHEKAHMLIFARWDELQDIADDLGNRSYEQKELIKLFYEFYFDEKISMVNNDHFERLRTDPLWSENGQISYARILSELLAVVNQYQMLPTLLKRFKDAQTKISLRGKAVPANLQKAQGYIAEIYRNKRALLNSAVEARNVLTRIDSRINKNFLFKSTTLELPILMAELEQTALPLPSAPIKTVFSNDELNDAIQRTWESLGNGNKEQGQSITRIKGFSLSEFNATLDRIAQLPDVPYTTKTELDKIVAYYRDALDNKKIHLYPNSPESYTIQGTHFTHTTDDGNIVIAEGYFTWLQENGNLDKALAVLGAQQTGVPISIINDAFGQLQSIESVQQDLYDKFIKKKDYLPVIEAILDLYGIKITDISQQALETIIDRHSEILQLPGMETHLSHIQRIMSDRAILSYHKAPVGEAFSLYAQTLFSAQDVEQLRNTVLDISSIVLRETSAPVIFLMDYKALTGGLSPQNFAIRDSLNRIRREIEQLEKRNVVIIAVDLEGSSVGAVKQSLDLGLLRKGATSDDFDYVVSYDKSDDLLAAIENEYSTFPADIVRKNIKILGLEDSPLINVAQDNGFAYQALQQQTPEMFVDAPRNVFLIDYLRSLGLTSFITEDDASGLSRDLRSSLHITGMQTRINTSDIPKHLAPVIDRFVQHMDESPESFRFSDLLDSFYIHAPQVETNEWSFLIAYLKEQYSVRQFSQLLKELADRPQDQVDALFHLYQRLQATRDRLSEQTTPTHQPLIENFFTSLSPADAALLRAQSDIIDNLSARSLNNVPVLKENLPNIFLSMIIDTTQINDSQHFVLERKIATNNAIRPVSYQQFLNELHIRGIEPQIALDQYLQVEIAPRKVEPELKGIMVTQKLFDESA